MRHIDSKNLLGLTTYMSVSKVSGTKYFHRETLFGLELLRFFLALGVVIPHVSNWILPLSFTQLDLFFHAYHLQCVPIFWALSGFVFYYTYSDRIFERAVTISTFLWSRFSRLYPLAWITLLTVVVLDPIYRLSHEQSFVYHTGDFWHLFLNVLMISHWGFQKFTAYNGPVWSVSVEIIAYVVFLGVSLACRPAALVTLIAILAAKLLSHVEPITLTGFYGVSTCLQCFFIGGFGFFVYAKLKSIRILYRFLIVLLINVVLAFVSAYAEKYFIQLLPLVITVTVQVVFDHVPPWMKQISTVLGSMTYSLYLIHYPVILLCVIVTERLGLETSWMTSKLGFSLLLLFLCLISRAVYVFYEVPVQRFLRKIQSKGRPS